MFSRLDIDDQGVKNIILSSSSTLYKRLSNKLVLECILTQLDHQNSIIRRNSIDLLTAVILTDKITAFEVKTIGERIFQALFDAESKVCDFIRFQIL